MDGPSDIAGRYAVLGELARGGMGVVYRAYDRVLERVVVVKRPYQGAVDVHERARREAMALRLLRVPGVVQLLDEGEDGEGRFLVTELVDGLPFPGAGWPIEGLTVQLLEVLARVHAAGILHRDLKPHNVLVDRAGHVRVLDFGIARGAALGPSVTLAGAVVGTPRYLSPEQLAGGPIDARADLYAVGTMLFEALSGAAPFARNPGDGATYARVWRDAPPLADVCPDAPAGLATLVDRLLRRLPTQRPSSAAEALRILGRDVAAPRLRLVGRDDELAALLGAARAGRPMGVDGGPGLGRTRLLDEVTATLRREGRDVVWIAEGERPYASVIAALGLPGDLDPEQCRAATQARLDAGLVLIVDPPSRVDRWSMALVRGLRGPVLGCGEGLTLRPLPEVAQRGLFWGPDKVLHLNEDGARELHRRARGVPARAMTVVGEWVAAGLARLDGDQMRLDPDAPLRLADLPVHPPVLHVESLPEGEAPRVILPWVVLGDGEVDRDALARLTGQPPWLAALLLEELTDRGLVEIDGAGRVRPGPGAEAALALWTDDELRAARRSLAAVLPRGSRARLHHLVQAGEPEELGVEARGVASGLAVAGRFEAACTVLESALGVVRWRVPAALELALLRDLVVAAFSAETTRLRELAAAAVRRADPSRLGDDALGDVADASAALSRRHFAVSAGLIADLPEQSDEGVELARTAMLVEATVLGRPADAGALLATLEPWARTAERRGRWLGWLGLRAYAAGEFAEAARLHQEAAPLRTDTYGRLGAMINLGIARLDQGDLGAASAVGQQVVADAARHRLRVMEARGWWLVRSAAYRGCQPVPVDPEIVDAATFALPATQAAPLLFNEAVIAWRGGDVAVAASLATAARRAWSGFPAATLTVDALLAVLGHPPPDGIDGLDARLAPLLGSRAGRQAAALVTGLRTGRLTTSAFMSVGGQRWEVLSPDEIGFLRAAAEPVFPPP